MSYFTNLVVMAVEQIQNFIDIMNSILFIVILLIFLGFLGTFADYAKRIGISIKSRLRFLITPIIYAIISILFLILIIYLMTGYAITHPIQILSYLINHGFINIVLIIIVLIFAIIAVGAITIYLINKADVNFSKSFLLSLSLAFSPLIDLIWAIVTAFIASLIAPFLYLLSSFLWTRIPTVAPTVFFGIFGILIAIAIAFLGPSKVTAYIFSFLSIISFAGIAILLIISFFFPLVLFLTIPLMIVLFILGIVFLVIGAIINALGIVRALGLAFIVISVLIFFFTGQIEGIIAGLPSIVPTSLIQTFSMILSLIKGIGVFIIVLGIILLIVGGKEVRQLMTLAMAIAFAVTSLFFIFSSQIISLELGEVNILGQLISLSSATLALLVFPFFVTLIYLITLNILRIGLAIKWLISPPKD